MQRKIRSMNGGECNSLILTIPMYIVEQLNLKANQDVDIEIKGKKIIITPDFSESK